LLDLLDHGGQIRGVQPDNFLGFRFFPKGEPEEETEQQNVHECDQNGASAELLFIHNGGRASISPLLSTFGRHGQKNAPAGAA
jgi:hypothetical protein